MSSGSCRVMVARRAAETIDCTVVVPAWNERQRLPIVLDSLASSVDHDTTEIVVVDDGSTDGTDEVAAAGLARFPHGRLIVHPTNRGKGAAVKTGVMQGRGHHIAFVDADNATDLSALSPMVDACTGPVGAVFGSRHAPGAVVVGAPSIRGVMGRVFNHVVRLAAGGGIADTQCGAKVFRAPVARIAFSATTVDGFAFDVEILRRVLAMGLDVIEHPVHWHHVEGTTVKLTTPIAMLRDIAALRRRPPLPALHAIESSADDATFLLAELFRIGVEVDPLAGDPRPADEQAALRVVLPEGIDAGAIVAALDAVGLDITQAQSRTWLHESGLAPS